MGVGQVVAVACTDVFSAGITVLIATKRTGIWDFDVSHHLVISQACRLGHSGMGVEMVLTISQVRVTGMVLEVGAAIRKIIPNSVSRDRFKTIKVHCYIPPCGL